MREIKFRSAHYDYNGNFSHFSYWGFIDPKGESTRDIFCSPSSASNTQRKAEEQYTGLKDKNGVEIYEGDVCMVEDGFVGKKRLIKFMAEKSAFMYEVLDDVTAADFRKLKGDIRYINQYGPKGILIIGNIHENPVETPVNAENWQIFDYDILQQIQARA